MIVLVANSTAASCTHIIISRDEEEKAKGAYSGRIRRYHYRGYTRSGSRTRVLRCLEIEKGASLTAEDACGWETVLKGELQEKGGARETYGSAYQVGEACVMAE